MQKNNTNAWQLNYHQEQWKPEEKMILKMQVRILNKYQLIILVLEKIFQKWI